MILISLIVFMSFVTLVHNRELTAILVGNGNNLGTAFAQTELTTPVYTPGITSETFETILETNFTTGFGRFLGNRDSTAQTLGPGPQVSGGQSNIIGQLGIPSISITGGLGGVQGSSGSVGVNGTIGATFTNTTNEVVSLVGPTTPLGSFASSGGSTGAIRSGIGQVFSQLNNQAASYAINYQTGSGSSSDAIGASNATIIGDDTISFATGDTFSVSGSEETVSGCEQSAGAAAYGGDIGSDGISAAACSSRGSFQG
eukprot:TRINITY_DN3874_c0_g1_i1.p1 TRINITY_DN3874_c0_g1~~TRINITY_DN3874_c0_g1_i1.p1  ORF type:complete len:257 (+),score=19.33 TRINITY_DN3874_c0_g1_i1:81-851(+)